MALLAPVAVALAAPPPAPSEPVPAGTATLLARYAEIQPGSCRVLMAPVVTLTERPERGQAWVARAQAPVREQGCAAQVAPVTEVWFAADATPGPREMAWQVRYQSTDVSPKTVRRRVMVVPR